MKNVCFLFGINGVGKSTIADIIVRNVDGAVHVSGSAALRQAFGGVSRAELERMNASAKHTMLRDVLVGEFLRHAHAPFVVCDTHLTVAIRGEHGVTHERMWDEAYAQFALAYCNVVASVTDVLRRRKEDELLTGRIRPLDPAAIAIDAVVNDDEFRRLFGARSDAHVIRNVGAARSVARRVLGRLPLCERGRGTAVSA